MKKDPVPFVGFPQNIEEKFWRYPRLMDMHWHDLTGSEQKCLDYILRRTLGWQKLSDKISLTQFERGMGKNDRGTGLSRKTIVDALANLKRKGYITSNKGERKGKHQDVNEYALVIEMNQPVSKSNHPSERDTLQTGAKNELPPSANLKQTIDNKTIEIINKVHRRYTEIIKAGAKLTEKGKRLILARMQGECKWTGKQLVQAMRNFAENDWEMENNSHRGITWFFESDERIDKYYNYESEAQRINSRYKTVE